MGPEGTGSDEALRMQLDKAHGGDRRHFLCILFSGLASDRRPCSSAYTSGVGNHRAITNPWYRVGCSALVGLGM